MRKHLFIGLTILIVFSSQTMAVVPQRMVIQGRLLDTSSQPITEAVNLTLNLYIINGANPIRSQVIDNLEPDDNGRFNIVLDELVQGLKFRSSYEIGITVNNDPEMVPRQKLTAVPYAFSAKDTNLLEGRFAEEIIASAANLAIPSLLAPPDQTQDIVGNLVINGTIGINSLRVPSFDGIKATGSRWGLHAASTNAQGGGIYASSHHIGADFQSNNIDSIGVHGEATNESTDDINYGGEFHTVGQEGSGVIGLAEYSLSQEDISYGGKFIAEGPQGRGVYADGRVFGGKFLAKGAHGFGIHCEAIGNSATGVMGKATESDASNMTWGGKFISSGRNGRGVYGEASNEMSDQWTYGGKFNTSSPRGVGVYGKTYNTALENYIYGGEFVAGGGQGVGVLGKAHFTGEANTNYGGHFESLGPKGRGVEGIAHNTETTANTVGGKFVAKSTNGIGAYGKAGRYYAANNFSVYGLAMSQVGYSYGGKFISAGGNGCGIFGQSLSGSGGDDFINCEGGYFLSKGGNGYGIYAETERGSGTSISGKTNKVNGVAVHGESGAATGYAAYFSGGRGIMLPRRTEPVFSRDNTWIVGSYGLQVRFWEEYGRRSFDFNGKTYHVEPCVYYLAPLTLVPHTTLPKTHSGTLFYDIDDHTVRYCWTHPEEWESEAWPVVSLHHPIAADLAENFPTTDLSLGAGDVVIIDANNKEGILKSNKPNDQMVAGIISTEPYHVMGADISGKPVALAGRVPCKVTDESGPIEVGDLLTTSSTPGHAMKATNPEGGTIVGKALEPLASGSGKIIVLVTLQ